MSDLKAFNLGPGALTLLASLQGGDRADIAEPSVYPGLNAFCDHAQAYFHNAQRLCHEPWAHDVAIFGALYCMRHGLELWLKWIAQSRLMFAVIDAIQVSRSLDDVIAVAVDGLGNKKREARRQQLVKALCVVRSVENNERHPRSHEVGVCESFARERVTKGRVTRHPLELAWPIPIEGHDLRPLWTEAKEFVERRYQDARQNDMMHGTGEPLAPERVEAACDLLGTWDKGGDGFRYPFSMYGEWYIDLPSLNLRSLGALASSLESTVAAYEDLPGE